MNLVKNHPAETAMPIAVVLAALIGKLAGVEDTDTIFYLGLAISFIPAAITWIVELMRKPTPPEMIVPTTTTKRDAPSG